MNLTAREANLILNALRNVREEGRVCGHADVWDEGADECADPDVVQDKLDAEISALITRFVQIA